MSFRICDSDPGPGYWERDNSHFPVPMSRFLWELFVPPHHEGVKLGQARYGSIFDHFDFARIRGRIYVGGRFVTASGELQKRREAAERALTTKLWRQDCSNWPDLRNSFRCRLKGFAGQNPSSLDQDALCERIGSLKKIFVEGAIQHFIQQPSSMVPVGDWVRRTCEWTGAPASEVIGVLQGCHSDSADCLQAVDELVEAINCFPQARTLVRDQSEQPVLRLERLRCISPVIEQRLQAYMNEYADRIITGFDITDATLRELPGFTLSIIASRLDRPGITNTKRVRLQNAYTKLRQQVPQEYLADFDEGLAEARAAYGLHDEDVRVTYLWPLGLIRQAVLAAAERLVPRRALRTAEDLFQTTPDEFDAMMGGAASPSAGEISRRAEEFRSWANDEPPAAFGEKEPFPSDEVLGTACARISSAITFYLAQMEECGAQPLKPSWSLMVQGLAASAGCYEGRARIVRGPDDFARMRQGDVLVARTTSPAYNVLLPTVGAVVTDRGGTLCHAAIIAREFGIPAVVGTNRATTQIPDGAQILVDGDRGFVAVRV